MLQVWLISHIAMMPLRDRWLLTIRDRHPDDLEPSNIFTSMMIMNRFGIFSTEVVSDIHDA